MLDHLQRQWRAAGHAPAAEAATLLAQFARALRTVGPGVVADEWETTAGRVATAQADALTGHADQHRRDAGLAQATPDNPTTDVDEHHTGRTTADLRTGDADHDTAAAGQKARLGSAFRPLHTVNPTFSHAPAPTTGQPAPTRRKGSTR